MQFLDIYADSMQQFGSQLCRCKIAVVVQYNIRVRAHVSFSSL